MKGSCPQKLGVICLTKISSISKHYYVGETSLPEAMPLEYTKLENAMLLHSLHQFSKSRIHLLVYSFSSGVSEDADLIARHIHGTPLVPIAAQLEQAHRLGIRYTSSTTAPSTAMTSAPSRRQTPASSRVGSPGLMSRMLLQTHGPRANPTAPPIPTAGSSTAQPHLKQLPTALQTSPPSTSSSTGSLWSRPPINDWSGDMKKAFEAFRRGKEWEEWKPLVEKLLDLELACEYEELMGSWTTRGRPSCVAAFFKNDRPWAMHVEIGDLEEYQKMFWNWWKEVMVDREDENGELERDDELVWENPKGYCGRNKSRLVVAMLLWWGEAVHEDGIEEEQLLEWKLAVEDATWTLGSLAMAIRAEARQAQDLDKGTGRGAKRKTRGQDDESEDSSDEEGSRRKSR